MKKKLFCFGLVFFMIANLTYNNYTKVEAAAIPVVEGVTTLIKVLLGIGVTCGIIDGAIENHERLEKLDELTDEEILEIYNTEQEYLNDMKFYMIDGSFGSTANCSVMTADGSILTLEEALDTATSMSLDDYMEMRKNSQYPTPSPGIDWGAIFIDGVTGGLMDFLASFLNSKVDEKNGYNMPYTVYTGDDGYINRDTGEISAFIETDGVESGKLVKGLNYVAYNGFLNIEQQFESCRMAIYLRPSDDVFVKRYDKNGIMCFNNSSVVLGSGFAEVYITKYSGSYNNFTLLCGSINSSGSPVGKMERGVSYAFDGSDDVTTFTYFSTNLPVFTDFEELEKYILGGYTNNLDYKRTTPINLLCDSYKNKIVTLTTVESYGVTPTPTPSPTPKPTSTPTPTPTPSPTPFPTWSGTGPENFTTYNFYTEITNILNPVQTTINNISQSITNIFNFFVIDTETVSQEINNINVLPTSKFKNFVTTFGNLKNTFSNETQDVLSEAGITNQYGITYPVLKVRCPKILLDFVPDNDSVVLYENDICYLILCDCSKYATYFIKVRGFLKACIWFGMIFYLMKELKPIITLSD